MEAYARCLDRLRSHCEISIDYYRAIGSKGAADVVYNKTRYGSSAMVTQPSGYAFKQMND
jgi:hypothetical protein